MALDPALPPEHLYLARGNEVNSARPIFTGDVFEQVKIPGVGRSRAMVVAHPCSFRGRDGCLSERIQVARVEPHQSLPEHKWSDGHFEKMPLPDLDGDFCVARLSLVGNVKTSKLRERKRLACLAEPGINQLQQRMVFNATRVEILAPTFQSAFGHTYEEAELLEIWTDDLSDLDIDAAAQFEGWIREGTPTRQERLRTPAERAPIRREMGKEIARRRGPVSTPASGKVV